jgi:hypothetical protein
MRSNKIINSQKALLANVAAFLILLTVLLTVLLTLTAAKAEEEVVKYDQSATPDTIPLALAKDRQPLLEAATESTAVKESRQNNPGQHAGESANAEGDDSAGVETCHFWGNSYSLKFHRKSCPFALAMNPRHVQFLKNAREALELGEKPCRFCLPPYWLDVSCKILARPANENESDNSAERKAPENAI